MPPRVESAPPISIMTATSILSLVIWLTILSCYWATATQLLPRAYPLHRDRPMLGTSPPLALLRNTGSGGFVTDTHDTQATGTSDLQIADVNLDANPDLVASFAQMIQLRLGTGNGNFGAPQRFLTSESPVA